MSLYSPCVLTTLSPTVGHESRLEEGLNFLARQFGPSSRVSQALSLLVVHSLVAGADRANLLMIATSVLNALEDTNMKVLEYAVRTNVEEVGHFFLCFVIRTNDISQTFEPLLRLSASNSVTSPRYVC